MRKWILGKYTLLFIAALISGSCAEKEAEKEKPQSPFFDLKAYFQTEIERLQAEQPRVRKTVMIGGQQEEKKLTRLNYEEELKVFLDSDINRTSWWDRYAIDSSLTQGQLTAVSYKAQTEDLKTRWIELQFSNGKVRAILIENESQSPAVNFFQQLRYIPEEGFFIFTRQKVTLSPPKEMKVEVIFE